jgi:hypothetical protein
VNDARKADRLRVVLLARYREPTMLDLREAECRDLSLGGMFVATARPSPRGGLIRFECESNAEGESFRGTARVVWQRSKPDPRGPAGMGVRFVHLEPASREALSKLVARVAQSPGSMPAALPNAGHRLPATEARAPVVPIVELRGPTPGAPDVGGSRSSLHAPTLRGVAPDADEDSHAANQVDPGALRRASLAPGAPPNEGQGRVPVSRVRTDPPPNLVSNPDRPRSDRPPAAGAVADEPAWSMPRDRTRLDGSGAAAARTSQRAPASAPGAEAESERRFDYDADSASTASSANGRSSGDSDGDISPVKIIGARALNSTAPGLGGPAPSEPPNDRAPAGSDPRSLGSTVRTINNSPPGSSSPASVKRSSDSDRPARSTLPEGSTRARPGERPFASERVLHDRPLASERVPYERPLASERPVRDRPPRERMSDRPPAPGGIDVLRPQTVVHLPSATVGEPAANSAAPALRGGAAADSSAAPALRGGAAADSSDGEVWKGQRAGTDPGAGQPRTSWEAPPAHAQPSRKHAGHDAAEEAEILDSDAIAIPRLAPPATRSPLPEATPVGGRSWGGLMLWLVIGSGLVVAVVLSKLFGSAPPELPDALPETLGAANGREGAGDNPPLALRYRLVVLTDPPGARVTVAGNTLVSPAEFGLTELEKPVLVSASLDGRLSSSVEINKLEFAPRGDHFERELRLTLPALQPDSAPAAPSPEPAAPVALPPSASTRPRPPAPAPAPTGAAASAPATTPAATPPFGAPVLPDRPRAMPPLGAPLGVKPGAAAPPSASAAGSTLTVTPSTATGSLATVTASPPAAEPAADNGAFKRATDCLMKGDNVCVIRELEAGARSAPALEMLIETYRATGDLRNAERHMGRYVTAFPSGRKVNEYQRLLLRAAPPASASPSPATLPPVTSSTTPAAPVPKNPPAPPMAPDP